MTGAGNGRGMDRRDSASPLRRVVEVAATSLGALDPASVPYRRAHSGSPRARLASRLREAATALEIDPADALERATEPFERVAGSVRELLDRRDPAGLPERWELPAGTVTALVAGCAAGLLPRWLRKPFLAAVIGTVALRGIGRLEDELLGEPARRSGVSRSKTGSSVGRRLRTAERRGRAPAERTGGAGKRNTPGARPQRTNTTRKGPIGSGRPSKAKHPDAARASEPAGSAMSRAELYEIAKQQHIAGRSRMSRAELARAIGHR